MECLDKWVYEHGNYVPNDYIPPNDGGNGINHLKEASMQGIQQVRSEIEEFIEVILEHDLNENVLEIGIGLYGGTHILWRQIFEHVTSIELRRLLVIRFKLFERLDERSIIIVGNSHNQIIYNKVKGIYDLLFIDGDHSYEGVKQDWVMYSPLVRKGGIVAFHDSACSINGFGIARFLNELGHGKIDGIRHNIQFIHHSKNIGIGFEIIG